MTSEQLIQHQVKTQLARVGTGRAVAFQEPILQTFVKLSQTIPSYSEILISVGDANTTCIDAADNFAVHHQEVVERKIPVRDDGIRR